MRTRLDRWLTLLGICSRSAGKDLIRKGAVLVNGRAAAETAAKLFFSIQESRGTDN